MKCETTKDRGRWSSDVLSHDPIPVKEVILKRHTDTVLEKARLYSLTPSECAAKTNALSNELRKSSEFVEYKILHSCETMTYHHCPGCPDVNNVGHIPGIVGHRCCYCDRYKNEHKQN